MESDRSGGSGYCGKTERRKPYMGKRKETILLLTIVCFWFALYVYIPYQTPYLTTLGVSAGAIGTVVGALAEESGISAGYDFLAAAALVGVVCSRVYYRKG